MGVVIRDGADQPRRERIQDLPDGMLRQLAASGSREAARELARRKGHDG